MAKARLRVAAEKPHSCCRSESKGVGAPAAKKNAAKTNASPGKAVLAGKVLGGRVAQTARERGVGMIHLSLSHDGDSACAFVVAERGGDLEGHAQ